MDPKTIETLQKQLETEKTKLEQELVSFAVEDKNLKGNWDAKRPMAEDSDMEERATESEEYDNLLSVEQSLELKLKDVNAALEKISQDKYGICEKCGKEINQDRLMANPAARLCMNCNQI